MSVQLQYVPCMHWILLLYAVYRHVSNHSDHHLSSSRAEAAFPSGGVSCALIGRALRCVRGCVRVCASWRRFRTARESCSCSLTAAEERDESSRRLCVYRYDINALSLQWSRWQHLHRLSDASTRDVWRALAAAAEGDSVFVFVRVSVVVWTEDRILRSLTLLYSILFYSQLFSVSFCSILVCSVTLNLGFNLLNLCIFLYLYLILYITVFD